jgi:hypothetical protein
MMRLGTRARLLLAALVVLISAPLQAQQALGPLRVWDDALHFLVVGDWGRNGEHNQRPVAAQMARVAARMEAEFVISTGDNFYPNGVQSTRDPHWWKSFEDIYHQHALQVDWFVVLGNHDYRGDPDAEVEYTKVSRRWRMPSRYFAETVVLDDDTTSALFVYVDTSPFIDDYRQDTVKYKVAGTDPAAQLRWIDSTLAAARTPWKFVVGHHHIYSGGRRTTQLELERQLVPLLERHRVKAYFNGHEHDLQHIVRPGGTVHYFVSGAGSEVRPTGRTEGTRFALSRPGFMAVSLTPGRALVQAVDLNGKVVYRTELAR